MSGGDLLLLDAPTEQACERLHTLLVTAGLQRCGSAQDFRYARGRPEIGLSSLEVILVLIGQMEQRGLDTGEFSPDWVGYLDTVPGIVHVMNLIDDLADRG